MRRLPKHGLQFGKPKTKRSARSVPLTVEAVALIKAQLGQGDGTVTALDTRRPDALVFSQEGGKPHDSVWVSRRWREVSRSVGAARRFHDLRHAFATFALKQGIPLRVVSEILGHSTTAITADTYTVVLPGLAGDAADAVGALFASQQVRNTLEAQG